jgi:hypothetical protein
MNSGPDPSAAASTFVGAKGTICRPRTVRRGGGALGCRWLNASVNRESLPISVARASGLPVRAEPLPLGEALRGLPVLLHADASTVAVISPPALWGSTWIVAVRV